MPWCRNMVIILYLIQSLYLAAATVIFLLIDAEVFCQLLDHFSVGFCFSLILTNVFDYYDYYSK